MLIHWIWFSMLPKLSIKQKNLLLERFSDPEEIYRISDFGNIAGVSPEAASILENKDLTAPRQVVHECAQKHISILTRADASYPDRLRNIYDAPLVLYCKGLLPDMEVRPCIGVVGTRKASAYGMNNARRMSMQIAACGGIVISGGATGIDTMALEGALAGGGRVVAVLGNGVDVVYPRSNRKLFEQIEKNGCLLSEYLPGTEPKPWQFPERNRIISGLSDGVFVVEAPARSGALITAGYALEQGRDVFVVPGNIDQPSFVGSNRLLRDGATLVSSGWDILSEYRALYPDKIHRDNGPSSQTAYPDEVEKALSDTEKPLPKVAQNPALPGKNKALKKKLEKKSIDNEPSEAYSDVNTTLPKLSADEQLIADALSSGERLVDDVIAETGLTAGKMLALLTMLELKGVIKRLPGKRIARK